MFKKQGPIWKLTFVVTTVFFLACVVVFTFDITLSKGGRKHALLAILSNKASTYHFYKVDDGVGFLVDDDSTPKYEVDEFLAYETNTFPFCLTCGWNKQVRNGIRVPNPYRIGDLIFSPDTLHWGTDLVPEGTFPTYDLSTGEASFVNSLSEIAPDADDVQYRLQLDDIVDTYDEISFSSMSDWDCEQGYQTAYIMYGLLLVWGLIALLIKRIRKA